MNKIGVPGCLTTMDGSHITCLNDPMSGEVYEHFVLKPVIGNCVFMGDVMYGKGAEELPIGEDGKSKLICRVLAVADMSRVQEIHGRLGRRNKKIPLLVGHWYRVHYD